MVLAPDDIFCTDSSELPKPNTVIHLGPANGSRSSGAACARECASGTEPSRSWLRPRIVDLLLYRRLLACCSSPL
ncbi:hypothetical protein AB1Y20_011801 [Prymnesium parvum]|uniref:Uncharacterized protein n=1 Tax=Prymnesium parvum TaxID=97485 RepID=A0AB34IK23_PRYPA